MYRLSVSAGTVLQKIPFEQRVREIAAAGFLVDLWSWEESAIDTIAADPHIVIGAIPGWSGGSMVHPDGVEKYMEGVKKNLHVAKKLKCRNLSITTGALDETGQMAHPVAKHPATMWIVAYKTLCRVAELADIDGGVVYSLDHSHHLAVAPPDDRDYGLLLLLSYLLANAELVWQAAQVTDSSHLNPPFPG